MIVWIRSAAYTAGGKILGHLAQPHSPGVSIVIFIFTSTHVSFPQGLLLRLPCWAWVCPCEDQAWRWHSCLDCRSPGSTGYSEEPAAGGSRNYSALRVFLAPGISVPVEIKHRGGTVVWIMETLSMPGEQRHRWLVKAHCQGDMALLGCFGFTP